MSLEIGSTAPEFNLKDQHGADISLSSFKGSKNVVITFYPFAFSGLCTGELCGLRDDLGAFQNDNVQLIIPQVMKIHEMILTKLRSSI
jgi:peroxiredoxin